MRPYLGVLPLVFRALNSAFSAPRIWTVEAGYLAKLVKEPAAEAEYLIPRHEKCTGAVVAPESFRGSAIQPGKQTGNDGSWIR